MKNLYTLVTFFIFSIAFGQNPVDVINDFSISGLPSNYYNYEITKNNNTISNRPVVAIQSDGKILINSGSGLERIDNNVKDLSFNTGSGFSGSIGSSQLYDIYQIVVQQDGKILVQGDFEFYNGIPVKKLIRLNSNGDLDLSFNVSGVTSIFLQPDGKIIVHGYSELTSGNLFRFNSDGSIDSSYSLTNAGGPQKMTLQSDGKLLIVSQTVSSTPVSIKRYNLDGTLDLTFSSGTGIQGGTTMTSITAQSDGKILVSGNFTVYNGTTIPYNNYSSCNIIRLNNDGTLDATFSQTEVAMNSIEDVIIDSNNKILVAANYMYQPGTALFYRIVRLNTNGSIDTSFNTASTNVSGGFNPKINSLVLQNDGKILIARNGNSEGYGYKFDGVGRLNSDGSIDNSFNYVAGFDDAVNEIVVQSDGKILVGGSFNQFKGELANGIIRFNEDYTRDLTFNIGSGFNGSINAIKVQPDGRILVGGHFSTFNGITVDALVRLNADGSFDTTFAVGNAGQYGGGGVVRAIALQSDGKILVGGHFESYVNVPGGISAADGLVRLNSNGIIDTTFNIGAYGFEYGTYGSTGGVNSIAVAPNGKIAVGGFFAGYKQQSSPNFIILGPTSSVAYSNVGNTLFNYAVSKILIEPNGIFLVSTNGLVRVNSANHSLSLISYSGGKTIAIQPDGNIIIGGDHNSVNGVVMNSRIARLNKYGFLDMNFDTTNTSLYKHQYVNAIAITANGNILVGGNFTSFGTTPVKKLVCLKGDHFYNVFGDNKFDLNNNGCDVNDIKFPFLKYNISNGDTHIPNSSGSYSYLLGEGSYVITPVLDNPDYFNVSPSSITVDFPAQASPLAQNFCVTPNGVHSDLEVLLLPVDAARPGFDANYRLVYKNKGNQVASGSVTLYYNDSVLDFVSASSAAASTSTGVKTWNYVNLNPNDTKEIQVKFNLNTPVETPPLNSGNILDYTTTITSAQTDEIPSDNTFVLNQTVVNSYDPNDKTCLQGTTVGLDKVGEYVHYVIRFENTGTYAAQNITIKDIIDTDKFDINTLIPLSGSHSFITEISDGNKVEFLLQKIYLPSAPIVNKGYVSFKIKTKSTLVAGDTFGGLANIFFDYNSAITTNTYTTTIQALSVKDFSFENYFSLYPNPVSDILNIDKKGDIEISSIYIYNVIGQLMMVVPNAKNVSTLDVSNLSSGNYFVKINSDKGTSNTKFIKR